MTMRYVHHVEEHHRPIPEEVLAVGNAVVDPDARIVAMLGARSDFAGGNGVATDHTPSREPNQTDHLTSRRDPLLELSKRRDVGAARGADRVGAGSR